MRKIVLPLLLVFMINVASAQMKIMNIKGNPGSWNEGDSFPVVSAANVNVANKINAHLQSVVLGNDSVETNPAKIFSNSYQLSSDSAIRYGLSMVSYKVVLNNPKIVSFRFDLENNGAYTSYSTNYFSFNAATGEIIKASDLLTTEGLAWIKKLLIKERAKRIQKHTKENYPDFEDSTIMRETFAECNQEAEEDLLVIQKESILFYKGYCFPHAWMPLETDLDIPVRIKGNKKYFTPTGKKLLSIQ